MKEIFPQLCGNKKIKDTLGADILSGKLGHAYIIEGARKSGKKTSAMLSAMSLGCEKRSDDSAPLPCAKCAFCRKIMLGFSPDYKLISRGDKKTIGVDAVRSIRDELYILPNESDRKIYVIDEADTMTVQAQNALLISLEEPPEFVVFFLLCEDASALIETVRSRAPVLRTERLTADCVKNQLLLDEKYRKINEKEPDRFDEAVYSADGSLGRAIELLSPRGLGEDEKFRSYASELCRLLCTANRPALLDLVRTFPKGRDNLRKILTLCSAALRDIMASKLSAANTLLFYANAEESSAIAKKVSKQRISDLFSSVDEFNFLLSQNASEAIITTLLCMK